MGPERTHAVGSFVSTNRLHLLPIALLVAEVGVVVWLIVVHLAEEVGVVVCLIVVHLAEELFLHPSAVDLTVQLLLDR